MSRPLWALSLMCGLASGAAEAASPTVKELGTSAAELLQAQNLVRRLGNEVYREREAAEHELAKMGTRVIPVLRTAANEDPDPEIRARVGRLLKKVEADELNARLAALLVDTEGKQHHELPGWDAYKKLIGADKPARELFVEMLKSKPAFDLISLSGQPADELAKYASIYRMRMRQHQLSATLTRVQPGAPIETHAATVPNYAALLFTEVLLEGKPIPRTGTLMVYSSYFLSTPDIRTALQGGDAAHAVAFRRVLAQWCDRLNDPLELSYATSAFLQHGIKEGIPAMKRAVENKTVQIYYRAHALTAICKLAGKEELPFYCKQLKDESALPSNRFPGMTLELRDVALGMCLAATKQDPHEYGFEGTTQITDATRYQYSMYTFRSTEKRDAAFKAWEQWQAKQKEDEPKRDGKK